VGIFPRGRLLTSSWGSPVALINEGMTVAFQIDPARGLIPRWSMIGNAARGGESEQMVRRQSGSCSSGWCVAHQ
jgi:hypothetical protein